jgi:single-strand DNA-binding protein
MNVLLATGRVGKDAELRYTAGDKPTAVCQFSLALTSGFGDKAVTTWLRCSVFGKRAETLTPMLTKGTQIGVTGEFTNRPYTDKAGVEKHSPELNVSNVTLLGGNTSAQSAPKAKQENSTPSDPMQFDDDIPF